MKVQALLAATLLAAAAAHAGPRTVCTITVNSPDEREVLRRQLPAGGYDFVELVERGRPDWLASSCRKGVRCDVLVVSGHFAGTEFYSSRFNVEETLPVDELERAACSDSCPGLFADLKEVYLFGCDTLNPAPVRHGESALDLMRRLFAGVPAIYGFSSKAPYGRFAGPMLERHFAAGHGADFATGRANERLLKLFAPASMTIASGLAPDDPRAGARAEACRYHDDRLSPGRKIAAIHAHLADDPAHARVSLARLERFFGSLGAAARGDPEVAAAMGAIERDTATRERYLDLVRATPDPAARVRLAALARALGWLDRPGERAEVMRVIADLLAERSAGFGEVDLICDLNRDGSLDAERHRLPGSPAKAGRAADAALACLGSDDSRSRIVAALASRDEGDVRLAQAYLRHRPITEANELRSVALGVAGMEGSAAQARALETLARHHIGDAEVLERLAQLYARTRSAPVQRAIAEVFLRSGYGGDGSLAGTLRRHRVRAGEGADVIDSLIRRLEGS